MILRKLTEAPEKDNDKPISVVSRRPSEIKDEKSLPDETQKLMKKGDWTAAYRTLVNTSDIELFIELFIYSYWLFRNITESIKPIEKSLSRSLLSMGDKAFSLDTNPLLAFIKNFFSLGNSLTDDQFKMVINWWNNGIIADKDLRADKIENSILLNQHLYEMGNNTFIVQAYYWLANQKNVGAYINLDVKSGVKESLEKGSLTEAPMWRTKKTAKPSSSGSYSSASYKQMYPQSNQGNVEAAKANLQKQLAYILGVSEDTDFDINHITVKKFRDMVIFVNKDAQDGPIHQATEIQGMLNRLQDAAKHITGEEAADDEDDRDTVYVTPTKWNDNQIDAIMRNGKAQLNRDTANMLTNYMRDKGLI